MRHLDNDTIVSTVAELVLILVQKNFGFKGRKLGTTFQLEDVYYANMRFGATARADRPYRLILREGGGAWRHSRGSIIAEGERFKPIYEMLKAAWKTNEFDVFVGMKGAVTLAKMIDPVRTKIEQNYLKVSLARRDTIGELKGILARWTSITGTIVYDNDEEFRAIVDARIATATAALEEVANV